MALSLIVGTVAALLAAARWFLVVRRDLSAPLFAVQLVKLVKAGNTDRARKLCAAAEGRSFGTICDRALAAFAAEPGGQPVAASAAAERAFEEEHRRQASLLGGAARLLTVAAILLALAAFALGWLEAHGKRDALVPPLLLGVGAMLIAVRAEQKGGKILRESRRHFPSILAALGAAREQELLAATQAAEAAERERRQAEVRAKERAERAVVEAKERAEQAVVSGLQRQAEIQRAAEQLAAAARTVCRFCERPYKAEELSCPHCGGPAAR